MWTHMRWSLQSYQKANKSSFIYMPHGGRHLMTDEKTKVTWPTQHYSFYICNYPLNVGDEVSCLHEGVQRYANTYTDSKVGQPIVIIILRTKEYDWMNILWFYALHRHYKNI